MITWKRTKGRDPKTPTSSEAFMAVLMNSVRSVKMGLPPGESTKPCAGSMSKISICPWNINAMPVVTTTAMTEYMSRLRSSDRCS